MASSAAISRFTETTGLPNRKADAAPALLAFNLTLRNRLETGPLVALSFAC